MSTGDFVTQKSSGKVPYIVEDRDLQTVSTDKLYGKTELPPDWKAIEELRKKYPKVAQAFEEVCKKQFALFARKHLDYGMWNLAAGSRLETPEEVGFALEGIWWRLNDKISRWKNIMLSGKAYNETLQDTFQDIINYVVIAQIMADGNWKE